MKGIAVSKAGDAPRVVDTLKKPQPADGQILVKSLYTSMNPM